MLQKYYFFLTYASIQHTFLCESVNVKLFCQKYAKIFYFLRFFLRIFVFCCIFAVLKQ